MNTSAGCSSETDNTWVTTRAGPPTHARACTARRLLKLPKTASPAHLTGARRRKAPLRPPSGSSDWTLPRVTVA
eukprot:1177158-Prorocentrum_minimum.AAC.3